MKAVSIDYVKLRGMVEWGWSKRLAAQLHIHQNNWGKRMDGTIPLKIAELNQFCRVLNDLGEEKHGPQSWIETGVEDVLVFEDVAREEIPMPQEKS